MTNPRFYAEWLALKALLASLERGDIRQAWARIRRAAPIIKWFGRSQWLWARRNLQLVYGPQLNPPDLERLVAIAFEQHLGSYLEGLRSRDVTVRIVNEDRLRAAQAAGRGVIVAGVHLGSWEPGLRWVQPAGIPTAVVYRRAFNPLSEREFQAVRADYGVEWIENGNGLQMVRALRAGKVLVLMTDLNTRVGGVPADFLGLTALCPPGPAKLARRYGCPILPCVALREQEAVVTYHFGMPIKLSDRPVESLALAAIMRQINATFEPWILEYAEQYNWFHPRWRFRPNGRVWHVNDPLAQQLAERVAAFPPLSERVRRILSERS